MHASGFRSMLFGAFLLTSHLKAGIEDLIILVSPDGKKQVVLAGDIHDRLPGTQTERLAAAIATLQKQNPTPFQVGIEIPGNPFTNPQCILAELAPTLKALKIPGLEVNDCEIRTISGLAFWLFGRKNLNQVRPNAILKIAGKQCIAGKVTFTDLKAEFEELYNPLPLFAKALPNQEKELFDHQLSCATIQMERFQAEIEGYTHLSNSILATAVNLARYQNKRISVLKREKIAQAVFAPFATLFNLNIIRSILDARHRKQLYLAGILHTAAIKEFLLDACWKMHPNKDAHQSSQDPEAIHFGSPLNYLKSTAEE